MSDLGNQVGASRTEIAVSSHEVDWSVDEVGIGHGVGDQGDVTPRAEPHTKRTPQAER